MPNLKAKPLQVGNMKKIPPSKDEFVVPTALRVGAGSSVAGLLAGPNIPLHFPLISHARLWSLCKNSHFLQSQPQRHPTDTLHVPGNPVPLRGQLSYWRDKLRESANETSERNDLIPSRYQLVFFDKLFACLAR